MKSMRMRWIVAGMLVGAAAAGAAPERAPNGIQWLSDFSGGGHLGFFSEQQDDLQEDRYVTEGLARLDFDLLSVGERWSLWSRFDLTVDLGKSVADNLPFSPKEMAYEFVPFVEYLRASHLARFGWNHACQHLIYKDNDEPWYLYEGSNVPPDVYWNRLFVGAGRAEIRPEIFRESYFGEGAARPRLLWYVEAGGYLRSFPGMNDDSLYGDNDWIADGKAEVRLLLYGAARWALFANSLTQVLLDVDDELCTRQQLQVEAAFASRGFGSSLYAGWHAVDEHPRDDKEGMLEFGAAFYY